MADEVEDEAPLQAATSRPTSDLLAIAAVRRFLAARFSFGIAMQIHDVGVGWYVYSITGSAWSLGLIGLAVFVPAVVLALPAGEVVDRFDRRLVIASAYGAMALAATGLLVTVLLEGRSPWPIYGFAMVIGAARAFAMPGLQALLPSLVPRRLFASTLALASSTWQVSVIAGPAIGGLLYAVGPAVVFATALTGFGVAALAVTGIEPRPSTARREKPTLDSLFAGIRFIRSRPSLLGAISLDLFAVLLGGATALLPIYARDILLTGPWGLGLLRSAPALGAATMGLVLAHRPLGGRAGYKMFAAVALFGAVTVGFGLSTSLPLSLGFLVLLGAADMVSVVVRQTLVQHDTPDEMRGRVSAVNAVFVGASNELGQFESGALAALVGVVGSVVIGGLGTLAVAATWAKLFPGLLSRDRLTD
ncbi:MFS transporter [Siculibacillus lacustris]|uniref:MFS transporter n=1 Tax=Siculibacillus lacustris TaxID=1549641 RepID=A0A4Q9VII2_9HYPH|nr:MFS transporter [Siculibacillus lacustris]TBW34525.1 MFS transporter [Siculibacillus lacustris]